MIVLYPWSDVYWYSKSYLLAYMSTLRNILCYYYTDNGLKICNVTPFVEFRPNAYDLSLFRSLFFPSELSPDRKKKIYILNRQSRLVQILNHDLQTRTSGIRILLWLGLSYYFPYHIDLGCTYYMGFGNISRHCLGLGSIYWINILFCLQRMSWSQLTSDRK